MRPKSIDEEFNDSYEKQGLQPSGLGLTAANDNLPPIKKPVDRYQAANDNFPSAANDEEYVAVPPPTTIQNTYGKAILQKRLPGSAVMESEAVERALRTTLRVKVASTNTAAIYPWAIPVYILQFLLAAVSIAFFGIIAAFEAAENQGGVTGAVVGVVSTIASLSAEAVDYIAGTDFATIGDPTSVFIVTNTLAFFIGLVTLFAIGLIYQLSFTNCLFGEGATWKIMALIVAIFGYFAPFLNLFPWFFVWTFAVWLYPR